MHCPVKLQKHIKQSATAEGFTIIELLIATTVFSLVLLLLTNGLILVGRVYYKGITAARTQEAARSIIDDISQAIQFGGGTVVPRLNSAAPPNSGGFCIGNSRYSYLLGRQVPDDGAAPSASDQANHGLVRDVLVYCTASDASLPLDQASPPGAAAGWAELLPPKMRLAKLVVCPPGDTTVCANPSPAGSGLYDVTVRVVYGDADLLEDKLKQDGSSGTDDILDSCKALSSGSQFCHVSELHTVVQKRI